MTDTYQKKGGGYGGIKADASHPSFCGAIFCKAADSKSRYCKRNVGDVFMDDKR